MTFEHYVRVSKQLELQYPRKQDLRQCAPALCMHVAAAMAPCCSAGLLKHNVCHRYMSMRRVDSDHGPLMENQHHSDGSASDVELVVATPSPTSPITQARGSSLSPRSNNGPSALSKLSPHV